MARKIRLPDEDISPVWGDMNEEERTWYEHFKKATEYHNWQSLQLLCDSAPCDRYEELRSEIAYDLQRFERERYTVPVSRFPKYSEFDYGWIHTKPVNMRREIQFDYSGNTDKVYDFSTKNDGRRSRRARK